LGYGWSHSYETRVISETGGVTVNGDTSSFSVRDLDAGTHNLMVTATNCTAALVTDTLTIVISGYDVYLPLVMRNSP
jgi:hypothetical protein